MFTLPSLFIKKPFFACNAFLHCTVSKQFTLGDCCNISLVDLNLFDKTVLSKQLVEKESKLELFVNFFQFFLLTDSLNKCIQEIVAI